jgi:hypothetical protein
MTVDVVSPVNVHQPVGYRFHTRFALPVRRRRLVALTCGGSSGSIKDDANTHTPFRLAHVLLPALAAGILSSGASV